MVEGLASKQVEEGKGAHAGYLPGRIEAGRDGDSRALEGRAHHLRESLLITRPA